MEKTNEILTIAGKRVRVAYYKPGEDCCARCCFSGGKTCVGLVEGEEWPCGKFDLATAYFVEAEQPEEEVPIEVCGKKVMVRYARTQEEACASCAFCSRGKCHDLDCNMRDIIGESECRYAYFVPAEDGEADTTEQAQPAPAATIKGWVARDKCGELYFFKERPTRGATMWNTEDFCAFMPFPQRNLPSLRWEDEPIEVEIIIKTK